MDARRNTHLDRVKYFFGYSYTFGEGADGGHSTLHKVLKIPTWIEDVVGHLRAKRAIPLDMSVDMAVLNLYNQPKASLGVHMDSKELFKRPVVSVRLFGDHVLSFGALYKSVLTPSRRTTLGLTRLR
jgi:alkylated DNA repair dioxygenase AlkB